MTVKLSNNISPYILPNHVEQIRFIESYGNYVKIHLLDSRVHTIRSTLKAILTELPEAFFCRIHNRYIVNLNQVQATQQDNRSGLTLTFYNKPLVRLQVSRSYLAPFRKCYNQFKMYDIPFAKNDPGYCF